MVDTRHVQRLTRIRDEPEPVVQQTRDSKTLSYKIFTVLGTEYVALVSDEAEFEQWRHRAGRRDFQIYFQVSKF